jgi:hypothetical protein
MILSPVLLIPGNHKNVRGIFITELVYEILEKA